MSHASVAAPSAAERVHNACAHADTVTLALPDHDPIAVTVHHLRDRGDVVFTVPADSPAIAAARDWTPAMLELIDRSPLPLRNPTRTLVWLQGRLHAVPWFAQRLVAADLAAEYPHAELLDVAVTTTLVRLALDRAVVADTDGTTCVITDDLRTARPDPFCEMEFSWLQHMDSDHRDILTAMAGNLPAPLCDTTVHPLALDRYGITLRIERPDGDRDKRLSFTTPVDDPLSLQYAIHTLIRCPFLNPMQR